jgi:hypothetical protein
VIVMLIAGVPSVASTLVVGCAFENAREREFTRMVWGRGYGQSFIGMGGQTLYIWPDGKARATRPTELGNFDRHGWDQAWEDFAGRYAMGWATACAWPWATLLTLMIFRASMRRAKVLPGHVRRCVLYSFDAVLWGGLAVAAMQAVAMLQWVRGGPHEMRHAWVVFALPVLWAVVTYRLGRAYGRYLQFDRPWATVIASQVIVALAGLIILLNLTSSTLMILITDTLL